jgi:hypothetical protein
LIGHGLAKSAFTSFATKFSPLHEDPNNPLAIFVDTNLPHGRAQRFFTPEPLNQTKPSKIMSSLLDKVRAEYAGVDPYNILVLSNHPQRYSEDDLRVPGNQLAVVVSQKPRVPIYNEQAMMDLLKAASLYGNVPTLFPPDRSQQQDS